MMRPVMHRPKPVSGWPDSPESSVSEIMPAHGATRTAAVLSEGNTDHSCHAGGLLFVLILLVVFAGFCRPALAQSDGGWDDGGALLPAIGAAPADATGKAQAPADPDRTDSAAGNSDEHGIDLPQEGVVVLAYFRFGRDEFPDTSVRMDQFEEHLRRLMEPDVQIVSLPTVIAGLQEPPPEGVRSVAISVDNAYRSFYQFAWPRLKQLNIPVTVFVATDLIDGGSKRYMTWDQLRELADAGVTIGLRGSAHAHLPGLSELDLLRDIRHAQSRLEQELGLTARLFSYPYGEYSNRVINVLESHGFLAAFGQHSGVISTKSPIFALPRFPITERFADSDRFELAINALPFDVTDQIPRDAALDAAEPNIGFTVDDEVGSLRRLSCFATDQGKLRRKVIGRRVELRLKAPFQPGRARVNCTLPVTDPTASHDNDSDEQPVRWRWLGLNYYLSDDLAPPANGDAPLDP